MMQEFFMGLVEEALAGKPVSDEARVYLVGVLVQAPAPSDEPVVLRVLGGRSPRLLVLKEAGDEALFVGGFFPEWLRRRGLERGYYAALGASAYSELAGLFPPGAGRLFAEMARRFDLLQGALGDVRGSCRIGPGDIQAAMEEWLRTRTGASERRLRALGLPVLWGGPGDA